MECDTCVARQAIFDSNRDVYAYELLFRSGVDHMFFDAEDGDRASARVMSDTLHLYGLDGLLDEHLCFINVTRRLLVEELYATLPPERAVLEVLETVEPDREVRVALKQAKQRGYRIVLDDFVLTPEYRALLPLVNLLKIDFMSSDTNTRREIADVAHSRNIGLLAEKVETHEDFHEAKSLGYQYFQGFFFCKPETLVRKPLPVNKMNVLRLIEKLNQREINFSEVEPVIRNDLTLSYKLLRYLNSAAFGFRQEITSVRHALTLLGERPLRKWASLVALTGLSDDKPPELMNVCLIRAAFCEAIMRQAGGEPDAADAFMLGLFSVLDALLDRSMPEIAGALAISEPLKQALVGEPTPLRPTLDLALAVERGRWEQIPEFAGALGVADQAVAHAYRSAVEWTSRLAREVESAQSATRAAS